MERPGPRRDAAPPKPAVVSRSMEEALSESSSDFLVADDDDEEDFAGVTRPGSAPCQEVLSK